MAGNDDTHPSWTDLDAVRTGEGTAAHDRHVETCPACRTTLLQLQQLRTEVAAATPRIDVSADVDARILWTARKQARIARRSATPARRRVSGSRWAIAASLILALGTVAIWRRVEVAPVRVARVTSSDIDGNGKVDIRDAFMLAKAIDGGTDADLARAIDGDAAFDSEDVDRIARQAVALGRPG